jgi:hypothetical protein
MNNSVSRSAAFAALLCMLTACRLKAQPNPNTPPTFQKGETISVKEEFEISTTTTLDINGTSISHAPSVVNAQFAVQQLIAVVDVGDTGTTITTRGPVVQGEDTGGSSPLTYKFVCNSGMHFDNASFTTADDDTAVRQETCELLERINQAGSLLANVKNGVVTTDLATTHVLLPVTCEAPEGSWALSYRGSENSRNSFTVSISNAAQPFSTWKGTIDSDTSFDDIHISLSGDSTSQSPAPSGGMVNASVSQVLKYHRTVLRQLPPTTPPAAAGEQNAPQ